MKDVDKITQNRGNIEEVLQGKFLTYLSNVSKCLMVYVFFTPNQEQTIKDYITEKNNNDQTYTTRNFAEMVISKMGLTPQSMKILVFKHLIEAPTKFVADMQKTHDILLEFKKTKTLKSEMFNATDLSQLKALTFQDTNPF